MQPDEDIGDVLAVAEEDQQGVDPDPETPGHAALEGGPDPVDVDEGDVVDDEMDDADMAETDGDDWDEV